MIVALYQGLAHSIEHMGIVHEVIGGGMGGNGKNITTGLSTAVLAIGTGMKAVTKVSEGEMGVRVKRGKARRINSNGDQGEL